MSSVFVMIASARALEIYLIFAKMLLGILILLPGVDVKMVALQDLGQIPDYWVAAPFLLIANLQMIGLIFGVKGTKSARMWCIAGESIAITLWSWLIIKSILIWAIGGAVPFWVASFFASWWLLWRDITRSPPPGVVVVAAADAPQSAAGSPTTVLGVAVTLP